ncbi:apolipoprotein Bb, tandem duplicate 1, partial [Alosa alosa]|uniref:apolipoprotein Bb, tandem duplicate 1 n=1 Tax=Alosa alosa TaxID=278164 RepID=UPI0020151867
MGDTKLCLVLLLSAVTLAHADNGAPCLMAKRYKPFHKYEYLYEAESLNFLNGAVNGPKGSCKVEIEVPGPCHYIVRTTECTLSEVADFDAAGEPVFVPAATTDAFKAAMEKNPLKVTVEGDNDIKLFPEDDEPINILNIKRGIISGFAVPVLEEEKNKRMPTIYGLCKTDYTVNAREDIATDVTLTRDLSRCDQFRPVRDHTSPLALITGMHYPLAQLIKSTQTCNYKFDNAEHHPVFGECLENHILVPFSHKSKQGVTNVSKQKATLLGVTEFND